MTHAQGVVALAILGGAVLLTLGFAIGVAGMFLSLAPSERGDRTAGATLVLLGSVAVLFPCWIVWGTWT